MSQTDDNRTNPYRAPLAPPVRLKKAGSPERTENILQFGFVFVASFTAGKLIGDALRPVRRFLPDLPAPTTIGAFVCGVACLIWIVVKYRNARRLANNSRPTSHQNDM